MPIAQAGGGANGDQAASTKAILRQAQGLSPTRRVNARDNAVLDHRNLLHFGMVVVGLDYGMPDKRRLARLPAARPTARACRPQTSSREPAIRVARLRRPQASCTADRHGGLSAERPLQKARSIVPKKPKRRCPSSGAGSKMIALPLPRRQRSSATWRL